jgi:hypothetical protein
LICDLNEPEFGKLGLSAVPAPIFRSTADEHEDPEKWGRVVEAAQKCGLKVTEAEAYRRFKIATPAPGEKVLDAPKPEPAFGGGFGGLGFSATYFQPAPFCSTPTIIIAPDISRHTLFRR